MKQFISVSVVEDTAYILSSVKRTLEGTEDFLCLSTYTNAEDAVMELPTLHPDIVLMDIGLPGMNGIEAIKELKTKCPDTQFMIFTIYENDENIFEALTAGATGYLVKTTPSDKLLYALHELHEGGSPMSTHIARKVVAAFRKNTPANNEDRLSAREKEVLELLSKGLLYKEIGDKLKIATGTVRQHIHKIYEKLHVQNRTEALNKYYGRGRVIGSGKR